MKPHREIIAMLDDYVDGELPVAETEEITRHLEGCPECAREVARIRALLAEAAGLPGEIEPGRDLWPGIAEAIGEKTSSVSRMRLIPDSVPAPRERSGGSRISTRGLLLAAAALALLVLLPATVTHRLPGLLGGDPVVPEDGIDVAELLDSSYAGVRNMCVETVDQNADLMEPRTIVAFQSGIAAADLATAELKAALDLVRDDSRLTRMLTEGYRRNISLVKRLDRQAATL